MIVLRLHGLSSLAEFETKGFTTGVQSQEDHNLLGILVGGVDAALALENSGAAEPVSDISCDVVLPRPLDVPVI